MPESIKPHAPRPKPPVSALLYPNKKWAKRALEAGEVKKLLGTSHILGSWSIPGHFLRKNIPGGLNLGERFFDWEESASSELHARLGRLKPQSAIKEQVKKGHACYFDILEACEVYRKAVGA